MKRWEQDADSAWSGQLGGSIIHVGKRCSWIPEVLDDIIPLYTLLRYTSIMET